MISKIFAIGAIGVAVLGGGAYTGMQYVQTTVDTPPTVTETGYGDSCCPGMKAPTTPEVAAVQTVETGSPFDAAEQTTQKACPIMDTDECPMVKPGCEPGDKDCTMEMAQDVVPAEAAPVAAATAVAN